MFVHQYSPQSGDRGLNGEKRAKRVRQVEIGDIFKPRLPEPLGPETERRLFDQRTGGQSQKIRFPIRDRRETRCREGTHDGFEKKIVALWRIRPQIPEPHVEIMRLDIHDLGGDRKLQVDVRMACLEVRQPGHQPFLGDSAFRRQGDHALHWDRQRFSGQPDLVESRGYLGEIGAALIGQRDARAFCAKQMDIEAFFKPAHMAGNRGMGHVQFGCGLRETAKPARRLEGAEGVQWGQQPRHSAFVTFWNNCCQGTAFERRTSGGAVFLGETQETDMKPNHTLESGELRSLAAQSGAVGASFGHHALEALKALFRPQFDPTGLSARLRRDAGIDECELERTKAANAPLIR